MWDKARYVAIIVIATLIDQLTKAWVLEHLRGKPPIVIWQDQASGQVWFQLQFTYNTGAAWGMFSGHTEYLAALSAVMILVMGWVLIQARNDERLLSVALSLMLGGAFGNLLDRVLHQKVTDFLHCYLPIGPFVEWLANTTHIPALQEFYATQIYNGVYDFPIFNIADSAVVVGTCLLLIALMRPVPDEPPEPSPAAEISDATPADAPVAESDEADDADRPLAASVAGHD
ncbi:MAG: Lipoprotein signal peptidase [bacterium]|nr:Lipoprotein signal peptidase [bacterium]